MSEYCAVAKHLSVLVVGWLTGSNTDGMENSFIKI